MLQELIEDMNKALDNDCYLAALSIAFMIPDICGKAEFSNCGSKKRYIAWYDEYIGQYAKAPDEKGMPYLSGEVVYKLRCSFLHQGTPNVDKNEIIEECCQIDEFRLIKQKKNDLELYFDTASFDHDVNNPYRTYDVNIRRLCFIIARCAECYYNKNTEKFDFFNCSIVNYDD